MNIKLSIIIPVYNVKKYLEKCLNSVLNSTFKNIEIICVNDGSNDGCDIILNKYLNQYKNIKVIHKKNEGVAIARRIGFLHSTGNYIHFLDSDDYIETDLYEKCFLNSSNFDICSFGFKRINEENNILYSFIPEKYSDNNKSKNYMLSTDFLAFLLWNKIFNRKILEQINFHKADTLTFSEDSYISFSAIILSKKFKFIQKSLYNYFYRTDSVTRKMSNKNHEDEYIATKYMIEEATKNNIQINNLLFDKKKFNCKNYLIDLDSYFSKKIYYENFKKYHNIFKGIEKTVSLSDKSFFSRVYYRLSFLNIPFINRFLYCLFRIIKKNRHYSLHKK